MVKKLVDSQSATLKADKPSQDKETAQVRQEQPDLAHQVAEVCQAGQVSCFA